MSLLKEYEKQIDWLLSGDPSVRYQVYRDLLHDREKAAAEQERISHEGWGAQLLSLQDEEGTWAKSIYSPKWISTTYTLLQLKNLGIKTDSNLKKGCKILLDKGFYKDGGINYFGTLQHSETCVTGIILSLLSYFDCKDDRIHSLADFLFRQQLADGGWNCQSFRGSHHSSFHTTISVLEGLWEYEKKFPEYAYLLKTATGKAMEFLLQHRLYKSHRTGEIVDRKMTCFSFPPRWRYDVMRCLDFTREIKFRKDSRFEDAIQLLLKKRTKDGYWKLQNRHPGQTWFEMEQTGQHSRWNTLRAIRILQWWEE